MPYRILTTLLWTAAVYLAVTLQTGLGESLPLSLTAAVAAWGVATLSPSRGVLCAALVGLACDAAGHDRLGLHLTTHAVLAVVANSLWSSGTVRAGWTAPLAAWIIVAGDAVACGLVGQATGVEERTLGSLAVSSLEIGLATAAAMSTWLALVWLFRRVVRVDGAVRPLALANRWTMLTE